MGVVKSKRIRWEEPPSRTRVGAPTQHRDVANQLKANPGNWGIVAVYDKASTAGSIAAQIRAGSVNAYQPAGAFEAHARTVEGERRVYARYVGPNREYADDE